MQGAGVCAQGHRHAGTGLSVLARVCVRARKQLGEEPHGCDVQVSAYFWPYRVYDAGTKHQLS